MIGRNEVCHAVDVFEGPRLSACCRLLCNQRKYVKKSAADRILDDMISYIYEGLDVEG